MKIERKLKYATLFIKLFSEGMVEPKFSKQSTGITANVDLEIEIPKHEASFKTQEFLEVSFSILNLARDIVTKENDYNDKELASVAQEFLENNPKMREDITIKYLSNLDILQSTEYEIMTKRNRNDIQKIEAYSILLSIEISGKNDEGVIGHAVELTRTDAEKLIQNLENALEEIKELEKISS
ncbi:MAG: hypothetical protein WA118_00075 [Carboxydocellales bacterium]